MAKIKFAGIVGEITEQSPNKSFTVVKLSDRITIIGTHNNKFNWPKCYDADSGFQAFITYIGADCDELDKFANFLDDCGGVYEQRSPERVTGYEMELKVKCLLPENIPELLKLK